MDRLAIQGKGEGKIFKLYILTFAFASHLGTYETMKACTNQAEKIIKDFRYDTTMSFSLICTNEQAKRKFIMLEQGQKGLDIIVTSLYNDTTLKDAPVGEGE